MVDWVGLNRLYKSITKIKLINKKNIMSANRAIENYTGEKDDEILVTYGHGYWISRN